MNQQQLLELKRSLESQNEALSIQLKASEDKNKLLEKRVIRERKARKEAELILEEKSLELYQTNLKLAYLNADLEDTIHQQIKELERNVKSLEKANNDIQQFTYLASHDLKTPLRAIGSLVGFIEQDLQNYPEISEDILECILLIRTRVNRMHRLLNSVLEYSSIGKNKYITEPIIIKDVIYDVTNSLPFEYHPEIKINGDLFKIKISRKRIYQTLKHVIENAIKYHHDPKHIIIEISAKKEDKWLKLFIKDNGPGIAPKYHKRIFQIFQTLETKDKNKESIGIGLPIVKRIVEEEIQGQFLLESDVGKGTTFIFCFPIEVMIPW
ncbi:MAG: ATP-binding protein [Saprospiraceae bacterium]